MSVLADLIRIASDPANEALSKALDKAGITALAGGIATGTAEQMEVIEKGLTLAQWAQIIGVIGGIMVILKYGLEMFIMLEQRRLNRQDHDDE